MTSPTRSSSLSLHKCGRSAIPADDDPRPGTRAGAARLGKRRHMKAIVCTRYGPPDVLRLQEVAKPVLGDDGVLVKVRAATVTAGDCEVRRFDIGALFWLPLRLYIGIRRPTRVRVFGQELAGEVESVGKNVKGFREGDQVFGFTVGAEAATFVT
ncbi:MAG: alcohol dehydrogenase catalytic domain-containing protein [Luteitalea sp.]|nr:alcohol dehydrogenase catalytic domain-containing protein [Luteitalea sp.]